MGVFKDLTSEGAVLLVPEMIEGTLVCLADTALEPGSADRSVAAASGMSDVDRFAARAEGLPLWWYRSDGACTA